MASTCMPDHSCCGRSGGGTEQKIADFCSVLREIVLTAPSEPVRTASFRIEIIHGKRESGSCSTEAGLTEALRRGPEFSSPHSLDIRRNLPESRSGGQPSAGRFLAALTPCRGGCRHPSGSVAGRITTFCPGLFLSNLTGVESPRRIPGEVDRSGGRVLRTRQTEALSPSPSPGTPPPCRAPESGRRRFASGGSHRFPDQKSSPAPGR